MTSTAGIAFLIIAGLAVPASAEIVSAPIVLVADDRAFDLTALGSYDTGIFDASAAEIVAYHGASKRMLVVNAAEASVEVLSIVNPARPVKLFDLQTTGILARDGSTVPASAVANSVAVRADGLGAIAVEDDPKTGNGWVVFFDATGIGDSLGAVRVGAQPDMVTFSPDGTRIVVANEGEPAEDYSVDPEGSISVIAMTSAMAAPAQSAVRSANFHAYEAAGALDPAVRIYGGREDAQTAIPIFPVSENLEPEYATISADSTTAWVSLQEANALAVVNLASATVVSVLPLGTVDRMVVPMDASDRDGSIDIRSWPVLGLYQPDTIASYEAEGQHFIVTANEGDSRDWSGYSEVARVKNLGSGGLAPICADALAGVLGTDGLPTTFAGMIADDALGRLNITTADGLDDTGTCYKTLYTYGARSFSIWADDGTQVFDSADIFERITAEATPAFFNSNHAASGFDGRSDDKGSEPEGLALGEIDGRTYAFIGFERVGGIAAFDITVPSAPTFVTYVNNRDFAVSVEDDPSNLALAGDLGPEGLTFISAAESPTGAPMLAVGSEVSGTTTLFALTAPDVTAPATGAGKAGVAVPELAATGTEVLPVAGAAAVMVLAGLVGLLVIRRQRVTH